MPPAVPDVNEDSASQPRGGRSSLRIAVGIATAGRPGVVTQMLRELRLQSRKPDAILVCAPTHADIAGIAETHPDVWLLTGQRGLTRQRNEILSHLDGFDIVIFLDDDFIPGRRYVECSEMIFAAQPEVVMTTGRVIADGILGPGLNFSTARDIIHDADVDICGPPVTTQAYNGYGCNMGIRLAPVRANGLTFDEHLPLYGWLEDVDFSCRIARYGRIVKVLASCGVHLGVKTGRQSGVRLGYSQIANPIYLVRKGTCSPARALFLMSRNIAANMLGALRPEPHVDRLGRASGNWRALFDFITGRLAPSRALSL
jgi:hypothetical protein